MLPDYKTGRARNGVDGLTRPDPREQTAQIVSWAICWPWSVVWTFCVYNPFRYIGEFVLREIQTALYEISQSEFTGIERDLALDPPPFPLRESEATERQAMVKQAAAPASENQASAPAVPPPESQPDQAPEQHPAPVDNSAAVAIATDEPAEDAPAAQPQMMPQQSPDAQSPAPVTWSPPQPAPVNAVSRQQLHGVKHADGMYRPTYLSPNGVSTEPAIDPWTQKRPHSQ